MTICSSLQRSARHLLAPFLALSLISTAFPKATVTPTELPPGAQMPRPVRMAPPVYPAAMRESGLEGQVVVEFIITTEGTVDNPVIARSNNPWFERPALDAILKWKFQPGEVEGRKVNVRASQLLVFALDTRSTAAGLWTMHRKKVKDGAELPPEFQWTKAPVAVATAYPVYPLAALQANQTGLVEVAFVINPRGKVVSPQITKAATPEFGLAVLAMIDTWAFTPAAKKDGTPCFAGVSMQFDFLTASGRGGVPYNDPMRHIVRLLKDAPAQILPVAQLDAVPQPISRRPPVYPSARLAEGVAGEAKIEFFIDRNGDVQLPHILSCSAPEFGYAAVQAIATWRYTVPRKNGKAVTARATIPLEFAMRPPEEGKK